MRNSITLASIFYLATSSLVSANAADDPKQLDTVLVTAEEEADGPKGDLIAQTTTVTKSGTSIMDTPRSISVITEQQMADQGITNISQALSYTAGVKASPYGNETRIDGGIIRGVSPVQYEDGLKALFGYYNNARQDVYSIGRVEVLKGPASVEYGQGNVGGVVNTVSKRPENRRIRETFAEYGSYNHKKIGLDVGDKLTVDDTLLYRFVGSLQDSGHQTNYVDDNRFNLLPSITWKPADDSEITLLLNYIKNESGTGTSFLPHKGTLLEAPNGAYPFDLFVSEPGFDKYDTERYSITVLGEHEFDDVWSASIGARYMDSSADYYTMYAKWPPKLNADNLTMDRIVSVSEADLRAVTADARLKANFNTESTKHNAAVGLDMQHATTDNSTFSGSATALNLYNPNYGNIPAVGTLTNKPASVVRQAGLYLNDNIEINDDWIVSLGVRADRAISETKGSAASSSDLAFTKNAGLMYKFENGISPYISYSESFEPVSGSDFSGNAFDPKEGIQYELGVKYQPWGTDSIFTASIFDITEKNRTTSDPVNSGYNVQTGQVSVQGLELEAQHKWYDFATLASFTLQDTNIDKSNGTDKGKNFANIPNAMFNFWTTYRPTDFWQGFKIGGGIRYTGETWDGADTLKTPSYILGDAMVGYEFDQGTDVTLSGRNLADKKYLASCLSRGDCFFGERRTFLLNVTQRF